ncbi:two-component sensor histidine kinase [Streptomyces sp. 130]|uniref:sensor histidine kinase n=1 Tax=Streptomyces sp. 130 TaxID=2591006 RepID=UPI00117E9DA4|nr:histidine kinase [Streptomyces sp. 130]TRV79550.1 two-component sensor histidine kinase [Streptomyces sp. 130]
MGAAVHRPARWQRLDTTVRDLPFGLLLLALSLIPAFHRHGTELGAVAERPFDALAATAAALESLSLALRRRWPVLCLALVSLGFAVDQLGGYHLVAGTALPFAVLSTGAHLERPRRLVALAATAAYVPLALALHRYGTEPVDEFLTFYLVLALVWGVGTWLRATRAAEADRRLRVAEESRTAERTRIARELHDVVTHHVTAMIVQAEAARYLTAAPDRLDHALSSVTDTGRRAVNDLRHLLDLLDPGHGAGERAPSAGRIPVLVEQARRAGQSVDFSEEGAPAESTGSAELVAYRVVQEALTNALKYAHGSRTSVLVRHGGREITVEVGTDGSGTRTEVPPGSGRGLAGLRERVGVLGGEFRAEPGPDGGFTVRARIPSGSAS